MVYLILLLIIFWNFLSSPISMRSLNETSLKWSSSDVNFSLFQFIEFINLLITRRRNALQSASGLLQCPRFYFRAYFSLFTSRFKFLVKKFLEEIFPFKIGFKNRKLLHSCWCLCSQTLEILFLKLEWLKGLK